MIGRLIAILVVSILIFACKKEKQDNSTPQIQSLDDSVESFEFTDQSFHFSALITDNQNVDEYSIAVMDESETVVWDSLIDVNDDSVWVNHEFDAAEFGKGHFTINAIAKDDVGNTSSSDGVGMKILGTSGVSYDSYPSQIEDISGSITVKSLASGTIESYYISSMNIELFLKEKASNVKAHLKLRNRWDIVNGEFSSYQANNNLHKYTIQKSKYTDQFRYSGPTRDIRLIYMDMADCVFNRVFWGELVVFINLESGGEITFVKNLNLTSSSSGNESKFYIN